MTAPNVLVSSGVPCSARGWRRRATLMALPLAVALGVAGCASEADGPVLGEEAVGNVPQAIEGGYLDEQSTAVVGVVRLSFNDGIGSCTGTLIAPNVVLTAQHCVAPTLGDGEGVRCGETRFGAAYSPESLYVTTRTSLTSEASDYHRAREVILPPGEGGEFCGRDQAIIVLDAPVAASEAVPMVPRVDTPIQSGTEYYAVGYGQQGSNGGSGTRYRRDQLFTGCIADQCPPQIVKVTEWRGDTGICQGDSGGPAIDLEHRVIGVVSRGALGCEVPVYGYVFGWADWLKSSTLYATSSAGLDAPAWAQGLATDPLYATPVGGVCTATAQCQSNACVDGYCTRPCHETAPCPSGYTCGDVGFCLATQGPDTPADPAGGDGRGSTTTITTGCSLSPARHDDPTNPLPWLTMLGAAAALWLERTAVGRRRS